MTPFMIIWLLISVLLTASPRVQAQSGGKPYRIGYLSGASAENDRPLVAAFQQGLRDLGYVEGKQYILEQRYSEGGNESLAKQAAELVHKQVDIFVTYGINATSAASKVDGKLPIVMANAVDPVGAGLVASLAHPGGNITGLSDYHFATITKRLELLKEMLPSLTRVGVLLNPGNSSNPQQFKELQSVAAALHVTVRSLEAKTPKDIPELFVVMRRERIGGLLIVGDAMLSGEQPRIAELALKQRLPSIYTLRQYVEAGGLMSYGTSFTDMWRRAATFVDKIFKGTKPAELPVEQPIRFEFLVNLKTAKQIGVTVPPNLLVRADRVIR